MTVRRKRGEAVSESVIYLDRDAVGTILIRDGQVTALDADGEPIAGIYRSGKEAMAAIISAAKGARPTLVAA